MSKIKEKLKKIKNATASFFVKASIPLSIFLNIGASNASTETSSEQYEKKDFAKEIIVTNKPKISENKTINLSDIPSACLDTEKLTEYLVNKGFTLADVIGSGTISRNDFSEFNYSNEDLIQMSGSNLMNDLKLRLEKKAKPKSTGSCTKYVREAWRDVTSKEAGNFVGINQDDVISCEDIWCFTQRGYAKDWPEAIEQNSKLLIPLGKAQKDGNGNIDFGFLEQSPGFICVVPGVGSEPGHTFYGENGNQTSDFRSNTDWIISKMNNGEYEKRIEVFAAADSPAPNKIVAEMLDRMIHECESAKELCSKVGENFEEFLDITKIAQSGAYWNINNPTFKIAELRTRIKNSIPNSDTQMGNCQSTKIAKNSITLPNNKQFREIS